MSEEFFTEAMTYLEQGFSIIPLQAGTKVPSIDWKPYQTRRPTVDELWGWFGDEQDGNIGIITGNISGVIGLDIDMKNGVNGLATLAELEAKLGKLPETFTVETPSGGRHLYYRASGLRNSVGKLGPGVDIRGEGGFLVAPPSQIDGKQYRWIDEAEKLAELPSAWVEVIKGTNTKRDSKPVDSIPQGIRNDSIFRYACSLRQKCVSKEDAERLVLGAAKNCLPPLEEKEALICLESAWKYMEGVHETDTGNAVRFAVRHGEDVRYCPQIGWIVWKDGHWRVDEEGVVMSLAKETVHSIYTEAANETDDHRRQAKGKWAASSESRKRREDLLKLAQTEPGIHIHARELDSDPWLLGVQGGVIELQTGQFREARRADYITKSAGTAFDPNARCPMFEDFLDAIFDSNKELVHFIQVLTGYLLTGLTNEQCLLLLYGTGANGKTTLLRILLKLLGNYGLQAGAETWTTKQRNGGGASSELARLQGARFVATSEVGDGVKLAENLVKQATGEDIVTCRYLYKEHFEFVPQFKILLACNHKPIIRGDDHAIWRRIKMVPFTVTIPKERQDKYLVEKLTAELPGILNWSIEGCLEWQKEGLGEPKAVTEATAAYRVEMDVFNSFLEQCCITGEKNLMVTAACLYRAYREWAEENNEYVMSQRKFGGKLVDRGFKREKIPHTIYRGVGLLNDL